MMLMTPPHPAAAASIAAAPAARPADFFIRAATASIAAAPAARPADFFIRAATALLMTEAHKRRVGSVQRHG
jgi:hypothetical protein